VIIEEQRLGAALAFIIAGARSDRVDVAPIVLGLWMNRGIAVNLAGRGLGIRHLSRLARPSMLMAPCTEVFVVCTGSC
jgi:hypothetical protein